jgi:ubiquinone/menaquinone biosynthesis C-methylase UbiE
MTQDKNEGAAKGQFDLVWDDHHVIPETIYPDLDFLFQRMNEATVDAVGAREDETILDIGCGRALDDIQLAKRKGRCFGLELSNRMIGFAREHVAESGVEVRLLRGAGEHLPFKERCFDKVFCKGAIDHFPDPNKAIDEIARILKPQGRAIITVANYESLSFKLGRRFVRLIEIVYRERADDKKVWQVPHDHAYKFDYAFLMKLVKPHLKVERAVGISMFFGFPWWGLLLHKLPRRVSLFILRFLDRLARRVPSLSDIVLVECSPREEAGTAD